MPSADLTLEECRAYRPELPLPDGFDAFWSDTLDEKPPAARRTGNPGSTGSTADWSRSARTT